MAASTTAADLVQHLQWNEEGLVLVTAADEDRFAIKVRRAVEILQQAGRREEFRDQFKLLLGVLAGWLKDRSDIERAFLTQRDGAFSFVVMRSVCEYDDDFEDELSTIDFHIANDTDLNLIKMDAIALPPVSDAAVRSFLDPDFVMEYATHGNRSRSSEASE